MFKNIDEAIDFVVKRRTTTTSFDSFKKLMKVSENYPSLKFIHVTGTNGKGSYVAYMMNMLINAGYLVGTFQSPHLLTHLDRIRVNNNNIEAEEFINILNKYYDLIVTNDFNLFMIDFLIMCEYFSEKNVDIVLLEVGVGGLLDWTNVIAKPLLAVIVTVGYDHMNYLGNTIEEIAKKKSGIIKGNHPVLIGNLKKNVVEIIDNVCDEKNCELFCLDKVTILADGYKYHKDYYKIKALADYQKHNSALCIESAKILNKYYQMHITQFDLKKAIYETNWRGRFEIIDKNPLTIVDGAHNEDGILALVENFKKLPRPIVVVASILKDKEYLKMYSILLENAEVVIATEFENDRDLKLNDLSMPGLIKCQNKNEALVMAKNIPGVKCIVICGSLYFISTYL